MVRDWRRRVLASMLSSGGACPAVKHLDGRGRAKAERGEVDGEGAGRVVGGRALVVQADRHVTARQVARP